MPHAHKATGATLALVSIGAALIAASTLWGGYPLGSGVPITLQTLSVLIVGAVLGAYRGSAAVMVYLALGTAGLPIWSGHVGGAQIWTTPRAGFLISFVLAAFVTGWMSERLASSRRASFAGFLGATSVGALGIITVVGWAYVGFRAAMSFDDTLTTLTPFLPGDIIKAFVAAAVASAVHAAYPEILAPPPPSAPGDDGGIAAQGKGKRGALASTA
ncbi:MAG: biotin transporter BioY [Demequinaceae bacterium]|nr:biotin transporter BioY [Demequinaceae bacterium]